MTERFRYDRGSKWMIQHHGDALLHLGEIRDIVQWRTTQSEVVQPRKLPDGLLEVKRQGDSEYHPYIVEIETYADRSIPGELLADMMFVLMDRGKLPDAVVLVLRPKGDVPVDSQKAVQSRSGLSRLSGEWRVVRLWELDAEDLLATEEPGLMPWVPLTKMEQAPETTLRECRRIIDDKAEPDERDNLLAVTQVMMGLIFEKTSTLFELFGGEQKMLESPILDDLIARKQDERGFELIVSLLEDRFGALPNDLREQVRTATVQHPQTELNKLASRASNLDEFTQQLNSLPPGHTEPSE